MLILGGYSSKHVSLYQDDRDIPFEEDILRHPYQIKYWMRYMEHKQSINAPDAALNLIYERALKELPGRWVQFLHCCHGDMIGLFPPPTSRNE